MIHCRCEYDDWRLQVACMLQPIPFPEQYVLLTVLYHTVTSCRLQNRGLHREWEFPLPVCPWIVEYQQPELNSDPLYPVDILTYGETITNNPIFWREIISSGTESYSGSRNKNVFLSPTSPNIESPWVRTCSPFWEFVLWHNIAATPVCQNYKA